MVFTPFLENLRYAESTGVPRRRSMRRSLVLVALFTLGSCTGHDKPIDEAKDGRSFPLDVHIRGARSVR